MAKKTAPSTNAPEGFDTHENTFAPFWTPHREEIKENQVGDQRIIGTILSMRKKNDTNNFGQPQERLLLDLASDIGPVTVDCFGDLKKQVTDAKLVVGDRVALDYLGKMAETKKLPNGLHQFKLHYKRANVDADINF